MVAVISTHVPLEQPQLPNVIPLLVILATFPTAIVGARLWTRYMVLRQFGLEDWFVMLAWSLHLTLIVICYYGEH